LPREKIFLSCAFALAGVAHVIGEATDQLGNHLGPAATGIVQSAVGNLLELFVCIFLLQAGLVTVVQTSLIGSILGNALLVLGLAFAAERKADLAVSVVLNSALQVAVALIPILIFVSFAIGGTPFTTELRSSASTSSPRPSSGGVDASPAASTRSTPACMKFC
jgi:Ca2+/H+ antiporter